MNNTKYAYLLDAWSKFYTEIDSKAKSEIDKCFAEYLNKILDKTFSLDDYSLPTQEGCSYFCNFIERTSSKLYGSAKPGNMYNYGISKIANKENLYYINQAIVPENSNGQALNKENRREETIYDKNIATNAFQKINEFLFDIVDDIDDSIKKIEQKEKPINAAQFLRKIVAMKNSGKFLFIYSDEVINTIHSFFCQRDEEKSNIEKNFEVTKVLTEIFSKKNQETDDFYMIRLSRFIWSVFDSTIALESKNMILHGAPGTGKTYTIKNTIKNMILREGGSIENQLVFTQFHPSYGYEEFIDGIKPDGIDENTGQLKFGLKNGSFKELCRVATNVLKEERINNISTEKLTKFYFVADEINRAELSRVFGELLVCLDEDYRIDFNQNGNIRNKENLIITQNSSLDKLPVYQVENRNYFGVPVNLYFIGTMNDIDRSVDSFDMALRRRFFWKEIRCNYDFIDSLFNNEEYTRICKDLNRYITGYKEEKNNSKLSKIDKVKGKEPLRLGTAFELGHAYFKDIVSIDKNGIELLWMSKIEPLLREYLRAEYAQDEIVEKLIEAKEIFSF